MDSAPLVRLDASDAIAFASDQWLDFIRETEGRELSAAGVLGRPFFEFAPNDRLAPLYRLVFRRVRALRQEMRVPLRLEGSDRCWHVDMQVLPLVTGEVECRYHVVHVEVPGPAFLTQCAWCRKVHLPEGTWAKVGAVAERIDFFLGGHPRITHGICPSCALSFRASAKLAP